MSSYSTDLVLNKLSSLNESQDSITSVSQWVLFHRRAAAETVQTWLQCLRQASSANRKLVLIYLANDVVQQSKARQKDEFPRQFAGIVAEAMEVAYRGTTPDVQGKIKRVLSVWRDRNVFEPAVLGEIDARHRQGLEERGIASSRKISVWTSRSSGTSISLSKSMLMKNSLISLHNTLSSLVTHAAQTHSAASTAYSSLLQSDHLPAPPVYLPRLSGLLRSLQSSKDSTLAVVKARTDIVRALEGLLDRQNRELEKAQGLLSEVEEQVRGVEATRAEVQAMLDENNGRRTTPDIEPPAVEALTPPPATEVHVGDEQAGLDNLDPEIVALLKQDMAPNGRNEGGKGKGLQDVDEYAP